ncbi:hypothetical protein PCASD_18606 [Puccinia coronata f. sp. avenae]|uniref:HAT C-terminal dimerisation domain-containing protein n=1 Tax=Puccinia coronata f. sp. avenae TaxID=200324 RepID=A0A2N5TAA0_9BASI|nr:hypothetical protein PCASD_18606 [Puccinia coronata f. sp. avenae]
MGSPLGVQRASELDLYLEECSISITNKEDFNIHGWWKSNAERFPGLSNGIGISILYWQPCDQ